MEKKRNQTNKRDILLITILLLIVGGLFLYIQVFQQTDEANYAHVYYGSSDQPLVTIDFQKSKVIRHEEQVVPNDYSGNYPLIDESSRTITLLGDYEVSGIRQIVVIQYDFGFKTVQIIEEQSPNNICSREGVSYGKPLICLPNRVRVEFETNDDSDFTI
ncbi:MAG: hypothetical protein WC219_03085 [Acholeplasmataceae bacterium]